MTTEVIRVAFDKTNRYKDADGKLHVLKSPISKATVNEYYGHEIPNSEALGLEPNKLYKLLRHPDELAKAAATFNRLPLLNVHEKFNAEAPPKQYVVGALGESAHFEDPYLYNSKVIWDQDAIDGVEDDSQREISCSYRYVADMTPGTYKGLRYDGVMRDIVGNHAALVEAGRAGSDVLVHDAKPEISKMATPLTSRKALMLGGALAAFAAPLLANDAKPNFGPLLQTVTRGNFAKKKKAIVAGARKELTGKVANDADLEGILNVVEAIQSLDDGDPEDDDIPGVDGDPDEAAMDNEGLKAFLKGKLSDEDHAKACAMMTSGANDGDPDDDDKDGKKADDEKDGDKPKNAMDAKTIAKIEKRAEDRAVARMTALRQAERDVHPYVGDVAMDSAPEIYRFALDELGVDHSGASDESLPFILKAVPVPGSKKEGGNGGAARVAMDAKASGKMKTLFGVGA